MLTSPRSKLSESLSSFFLIPWGYVKLGEEGKGGRGGEAWNGRFGLGQGEGEGKELGQLRGRSSDLETRDVSNHWKTSRP